MKRRYDITHAVILILILVVAYFIGNTIIRGILLLLFSVILVWNTVAKLRMKKEDRFTDKIFLGILLFLDSILVLGSVYIIVSSFIEIL